MKTTQKIGLPILVILTITAAGVIQQIKFIPQAAGVKFQVFVTAKKSSTDVVPQKKQVEADGVITGLQGGVVLDSTNTMPSTINASVSVATINTGVDMRDESLKSADFFEVAKFPTIEFSSNNIKGNNQNCIAEGVLKIKNVAKKITIPFTQVYKTDTTFYKGNFTINRYDYNVGTKDDGVGNEVAIEFSLPIINK